MNSEHASFHDQDENSKTILRRLRAAVWFTAVCAGFVQAWAYRFYIEPDGVNYFDVAGAYLRRDWTNALNAYWSPLYSWLLALIQVIFHPSPYWESSSLHLLNLVLLLFALAAFEFFFRRCLFLLSSLQRFLGLWFVWLPSVAALSLYSLVLVEPRYVGASLTVVCVLMFAAVPWRRIQAAAAARVAVVLAVSLTSGIVIVKDAVTNLGLCLHHEEHTQWQVAQNLNAWASVPEIAWPFGHTTVAYYGRAWLASE